jgi:hypothetical protein
MGQAMHDARRTEKHRRYHKLSELAYNAQCRLSPMAVPACGLTIG